jgi:AcrR family transcriptional regulator
MAQTLKDSIIDAFIARFNVEGPSLRLSEVASALHISKKTIYKVFPSKASIYDAIIAQATSEINARKEEIIASAEPTAQKLFDLLTIKTSYEGAFNMPRLSELKEGEPAVYANLLKAYEVSWASVVTTLEQGKKEGIIPQDANLSLIVVTLTGAYQALYKDDFLKKNRLSYTDAVVQIAKIVLNGILVR